MAYCHVCDERFERGTILCPGCGSKLDGGGSDTETTADWSTDDSTGDDATWSSDDTGWTGEEPTDTDFGWSSTDETSAPSETTVQEGSRSTTADAGAVDRSEPRYHDTDIFEFSVTFPLGKGGKPLLIDSALVLFSVLVVPAIFSYGYSYRVGRAAARGDEEVPSFDDWGGLGKDGLILFAVYLGVSIAFAAVGAVFVGAISAVGNSPELTLLLFGIGALVLLAGVYIAGAILPVLIGTGSLGETFSDGRILEFAFSRHYLKGVALLFVFSILLYFAVSIVAFILTITVFGIVLLIPLYFVLAAYTTNMMFAVFGYIYNEAAAAGDVTPVEPDASLGLD